MTYEFNEQTWRRTKQLIPGKVYFVCTRDAIAPVGNNFGEYPWGRKDSKVPVRVISDDSQFYTAEVLEHKNEVISWGPSKPYRVTIDKFELNNETFKAWEEVA